MKLKTLPVLLIIYNKPNKTLQVFESIRKNKPTRLYVASDGPNKSKKDIQLVRESRDIVREVDWPCRVLYNYQSRNLGCKDGVVAAINWFFENEKEGIILEDDCLPDDSFYRYCSVLIDRYRDNDKVAIIGGSNPFQHSIANTGDSYTFSLHNRIWGWATWKRVWDQYDPSMNSWPKNKENMSFASLFSSKKAYSHWEKLFDQTYNGNIDTWDYQLFYSRLKNNQLTIIPRGNLVSNIGFGIDATHTKMDIHGISNYPTESMIFPIQHPKKILQDKVYDSMVESNFIEVNYFKVLFRFFMSKISMLVN